MQTSQVVPLYLRSNQGPSTQSQIASIYADPIVRSLLLVNVEARNAALSVYLPGFYSKDRDKVVWINPKLDTIHVRHMSIFLLGKYEISKHVERIALAVEDWEWFDDVGFRSYLCRQIKFMCEKMRALKEVQIVVWDKRNWAQTERSPVAEMNASTSRTKMWVDAWHNLAIEVVKKRKKTVEQFRQVMEQTRSQMGFSPLPARVTVRAIALGISEIESTWDQKMELLYTYRSYIEQFESWKARMGY